MSSSSTKSEGVAARRDEMRNSGLREWDCASTRGMQPHCRAVLSVQMRFVVENEPDGTALCFPPAVFQYSGAGSVSGELSRSRMGDFSRRFQ